MAKYRLQGMDFIKGLAMIAVIAAHTSFWITDVNKMYFHGWWWMIFQFCGPAGFAVVTSIGITMSVRGKQEKMIKNPNPNLKKTSPLIGILQRAAIMYGIGILYVADFTDWGAFFNPFLILRIHLFQLIAICQVVTYFALKLAKKYRILVVIIIILIGIYGYDFIIYRVVSISGIPAVEWESFNIETLFTLYNVDSSNILSSVHFSNTLNSIEGWIYILFFRYGIKPICFFPWVLIPFLGSIIGEYIYYNLLGDMAKFDVKELKNQKVEKKDSKTKNNVSEDKDELAKELVHKIKPIYYYGLLLYFIGIISGFLTTTYFRGLDDLKWLNSGGILKFESYPYFLFNGTWQSLFYCCGIVIFFVGLGIKFNDFIKLGIYKPDEEIKISLFDRFWLKLAVAFDKFVEILQVFGRYSMTGFVLHFVLLFFIEYLTVFLNIPVAVDPFIMSAIAIPYICLNIFIVYIWGTKYNGNYTLEDLTMGIFVSKPKNKNQAKKSEKNMNHN
ncbi:MAG: hypothetical protein GY870_07505 [archaeon]|nr:hypothetical protein [archaeon]